MKKKATVLIKKNKKGRGVTLCATNKSHSAPTGVPHPQPTLLTSYLSLIGARSIERESLSFLKALFPLTPSPSYPVFLQCFRQRSWSLLSPMYSGKVVNRLKKSLSLKSDFVKGCIKYIYKHTPAKLVFHYAH